MSTFVYLLERQEPYEPSMFMGIFSTMAKAKAEGQRVYPARPLLWNGNRRHAYSNVGHRGTLVIAKIRVDESVY